MGEVHFDPNIDLGDIIKFISFLLSGLYFVWRMQSRIDMLGKEISVLKDNVAAQNLQLVKFADALVAIARQDERVNALDRRIEDMRHGRGFVIAREFDTSRGIG